MENRFSLPIGFFHARTGIINAPNSLNYLNFGVDVWVIGHEITHGFDKGGSQFDEDGTLTYIDFIKTISQNNILS